VNKILLFIMLALGPVFFAPGLPQFRLSAGGGLTLGSIFTRYTLTADEDTLGFGYVDLTMKQQLNQFNAGGHIFFDATYTEFSVDLVRGFNSYRESMEGPTSGPLLTGTGSELTLGFTLLGKYPFRLGGGFVLYPLAGIEYRIALMEKRRPKGDSEYDRQDGVTEFDPDRDYSLSMWNSFYIDIGAGLDVALNEPLYLRAELLYGFRLKTAYEKAAINYLRETYGISEPSLTGNPRMTGVTSGPELRVALGYHFL
jgi:opacity protein-like surface antigen